MNKKIPFLVLVSITISFVAVYFVNDFYRTNSDVEKWEYSFYTQEFDPESEKLFLIGSSFTVRINQTQIEKVLQENGRKIDVYNLGKPQDWPLERLESLDMIINSRPDYVVYTIGYRDLHLADESLPSEDSEISFVGKFTKLNGFTQDIIPINNLDFGIDFDNFDNPKFTTLKLIDEWEKKKRPSPLVENPKHPFQYQGPKAVMTMSEMEDKYKKMKYRNNVEPLGGNGKALDKILSELTSNDIKVFLHLSPYHEWYHFVIPEQEKEDFYSYVNEMSKKYGVKVIDNQNKYSDLEIWNDYRHIAFHKDSKIYFDDIANGIIEGLEN